MGMTGATITEEHRPEFARLLVRNDAPFVARDRVREVETRLAAAGVQVTVEHWGRRIPWNEDYTALERYERFTTWADEADVSLEPAFHRTCYECQFTDESTEVLVPPVVTLVAYGDVEDDEQTPLAVFPHHDGSRSVSLEEGLEAIERVLAVRTA